MTRAFIVIPVVLMCPSAEAQVRDARTGMEFVRIEPGEFMMGCSSGDNGCDNNEKPAHRVRITRGFEIGKYEVTQAQWEAVMGNNPSYFKGANLPVEQISWNDVQEFLQKLNASQDGYRYRLPTEAEWEYAARAGRSMASRPVALDSIAWYGNNAGREILDSDMLARNDRNNNYSNYTKQLLENGNQTHPVGQKRANAWGLYDTIGNVWEWVQDWYDEEFYARSAGVDPMGPSAGTRRVLRGGSWLYPARYARVSGKSYMEPTSAYNGAGVRCVREAL